MKDELSYSEYEYEYEYTLEDTKDRDMNER